MAVIHLCYSLGCDVNAVDAFAEPAVIIPICQGDFLIVDVLLKAGCKLNSRSWGNIRYGKKSLLLSQCVCNIS